MVMLILHSKYINDIVLKSNDILINRQTNEPVYEPTYEPMDETTTETTTDTTTAI